LNATRPKFDCELRKAIAITKQSIFEECGMLPDTISLPINLYFKLIFQLGLHEKPGFNGVLREFEGLKIKVEWINSDEFRIFKADMVKDY